MDELDIDEGYTFYDRSFGGTTSFELVYALDERLAVIKLFANMASEKTRALNLRNGT